MMRRGRAAPRRARNTEQASNNQRTNNTKPVWHFLLQSEQHPQ
jgi:hypothetical protein